MQKFVQNVYTYIAFTLLIASVPTVPSAATRLPPRFSETAIIPSGLVRPTTMAFAPDGRLFIAEQGGRLRIYKNGELLSTPAVRLAVNSLGERGLLGIAFDPNFKTNQYLYLYYTTSTAPIRNRVSRFTMSGDTVVDGSEHILIQMESLHATNHNGGAIHFGTDDKLYIAVGENAMQEFAQQLDTLKGKMLRLNPDGTIPTDNPFYTRVRGKHRAIWARGLRNPFTFAVQPGSGRIFINDVGQSDFEEINQGRRGANYGWPDTEGRTSDPRFVSPLYAYPHEAGACAIAGGTFYNPPVRQFPVEYTGDYFFADLCGGWIRHLDVPTNTVSNFATGTPGQLVDVQVGPEDGGLYYLARNSPFVNRIDYHRLASPLELLDNGGFEMPSPPSTPLPDAWQASGLTNDRRVCNRFDRPSGQPDRLVADEGNCAFRFFGAPEKFARLIQSIASPMVAPDDVLTLSGVVRAANVPDSTGLIRAMITYDDQTSTNIRLTVRGGTYGYAGFVAEAIRLKKPVSSLTVSVQYSGAQGALTVDRISLVKRR